MNMKTMVKTTAAAAASAALLSGCAMFRSNVQEVNVAEPQHLSAGYDFTDLRKLSEWIRLQRQVAELNPDAPKKKPPKPT